MLWLQSAATAADAPRGQSAPLPRGACGRGRRGLNCFGASFIVGAAVIHMLRVVLLGSYKKPRELNWVIGVVLFLIILGFALTGYLLPWDQRAYWATTVTLNAHLTEGARRTATQLAASTISSCVHGSAPEDLYCGGLRIDKPAVVYGDLGDRATASLGDTGDSTVTVVGHYQLSTITFGDRDTYSNSNLRAGRVPSADSLL